MKHASLALAATLALAAPAHANAQDGGLSFNLGATSDYRYRGVSQSRLRPALQGGVDYALPAGWYVGAWASTIRWIEDAGGDANAEVDLYGGYKTRLGADTTVDVGLLAYRYPGNGLAPNANTTEIYAALGWGPATLKYSHSVTNLFGVPDSENSGYLDLSATFGVAGFDITPHIGRQRVDGSANLSYTDYALTVSKDIRGFVVSAALVGARTRTIGGVDAYASPANGKDLARDGLVVAVRTSF